MQNVSGEVEIWGARDFLGFFLGRTKGLLN